MGCCDGRVDGRFVAGFLVERRGLLPAAGAVGVPGRREIVSGRSDSGFGASDAGVVGVLCAAAAAVAGASALELAEMPARMAPTATTAPIEENPTTRLSGGRR
jgi:hypothetical protein